MEIEAICGGIRKFHDELFKSWFTARLATSCQSWGNCSHCLFWIRGWQGQWGVTRVLIHPLNNHRYMKDGAPSASHHKYFRLKANGRRLRLLSAQCKQINARLAKLVRV